MTPVDPGAHRHGLPLAEGAEGQAVRDIQGRLTDLGLFVRDAPGFYGPGTRACVEAFQRRRGLRVDGICGPQTWSMLVEAGRRLGDRFLYRRTPMLRGDDVAEVQQLLCALGFDTGRIDGIFGDDTARALREFQQNADLPADGILGADTLQELRRLQGHDRLPGPLVLTVRAREILRQAPQTLVGRCIALGEPGGLGVVAAALSRRLSALGAIVVALHHPDDSARADQANDVNADVYLGLRLEPERRGCMATFYSGYRDESVGGRLLAEAIQRIVPSSLELSDLGARGMSVAILRETRMPAVVVEVGPATVVVEHGALLADGLTAALATWVSAPAG